MPSFDGGDDFVWILGPAEGALVCAPNLNLIERLWWFFKNATLWNTHFPAFTDFRAAIRAFFATLPTRKHQLQTLITNKPYFIGEEPAQIPSA